MSLPARVTTLTVAFLAVVALAVFVVVHFFLAGQPAVDFTSGVTANTGANVNVGGLIASTLNLTDERVTKGLLYLRNSFIVTPVFTNNPAVITQPDQQLAPSSSTPTANSGGPT